MLDLEAFMRSIDSAPLHPKAEWILSFVESKEVLDIGCIGHSIERVDQDGDNWLHGKIRRLASATTGVDILAYEAQILRSRGFHIVTSDVESLDLGQKFDVIVCGDLIEHVTNHEALFASMRRHLRDSGCVIITTPNPLSMSRILNIVGDGATPINTEHTCWICPQTMYQLTLRCGFEVDEFAWLATDFPMRCARRPQSLLLNLLSDLIGYVRPRLQNDFGVRLVPSTSCGTGN